MKSLKKILVSVIVPIYNSEKYIQRCIESILNQSYKNLEIILVNDGSTDDSLKICEKYSEKDDRIRVVNQKNSGVSLTRNMGIELSSGEYIMFVDSDDYIESTMIEDMVNKIVDNNINLIISGIRMNYIKDNKIIKKQEYKLENKNYDKKELLNAILNPIELICLCGPCCKLYNREKIFKHNIRFTEDLSMGEDTWFNLDYLSIFDSDDKIVTLENIYYNYMRENKDSLFSKYYDNYIYITEKVYNKFLTLLCNEADENTVKRFKKMYAINLIYANSINFKFQTSKDKKVKDINYTINNNIVQKVVKERYSTNIKEKVLFVFIKRKCKFLLYLYFKIKYRCLRNNI